MTQGAHILGLVFMGVIYALLAAVLNRWIDSRTLLIVVLVLLFVPVFIASHGLADVLKGPSSREEGEEAERRRKARHLSRRGQKKQRSGRRKD
jgi:ABC-type dipeptide/oligopeptide/nickel transport system permease subunit